MRALSRQVGLGGALLLGLGSMLGTGVFVSLAQALDLGGGLVLPAVVLAGLLAMANGLSSAQLAAHNPVSGGTFEHATRYLGPGWGFLAGWSFLLAKTASAGAAALAFGTYVGRALGWGGTGQYMLAMAVVVAGTAVVLGGVRRSNRVNLLLVALVLGVLATFVVLGLGQRGAALGSVLTSATWDLPTLFHAAAVVFVAYTGYGRVATLGEEIQDPARNIPRAVVGVVLVTAALYLAVAATLCVLPPGTWTAAAPLEAGATALDLPALVPVLAAGAAVAVGGVLMNLVLGLSRVWLAMGRRGAMPRGLARVNDAGTTPIPAVLLTGLTILLVVQVRDLRLSWTFSAAAVLVYYGLTNAAALALPPEGRRHPRWVSVAGLLGCGLLAAFLPRAIQATAAGAALAGLATWAFRQRVAARRARRSPGSSGS